MPQCNARSTCAKAQQCEGKKQILFSTILRLCFRLCHFCHPWFHQWHRVRWLRCVIRWIWDSYPPAIPSATPVNKKMETWVKSCLHWKFTCNKIPKAEALEGCLKGLHESRFLFWSKSMLYHIFKIKADLLQKNRVADQLMSGDEDQETEDVKFDPILQPEMKTMWISVWLILMLRLYI